MHGESKAADRQLITVNIFVSDLKRTKELRKATKSQQSFIRFTKHHGHPPFLAPPLLSRKQEIAESGVHLQRDGWGGESASLSFGHFAHPNCARTDYRDLNEEWDRRNIRCS